MTHRPQITAALMLKAPRPGLVKTRLAKSIGEDRAAAVYRRLVEYQISQIPSTWQIAIHFSPVDAEPEMQSWLSEILPPATRFTPQPDGDLGSRLQTAVKQDLDLGADAVALIGGDCPYLDSTVLESIEAASALTDLVIVPATDGGYVLLAVKADIPTLFTDIAWSTDAVLSQTLAAAKAENQSITRLAPRADVDDALDLAKAPAWVSMLDRT